MGFEAFETYLAQKKTATSPPASSVRTANKREIPRTPLENSLEPDGGRDLPAGLLLLWPLRHRRVAVGRPGRLNGEFFTPGAERLVSLAGSLSDSFEEAAERVLPEMAGTKCGGNDGATDQRGRG